MKKAILAVLFLLVASLALAEELSEEERFGADYVAYRTAREKHFAGDFLEAYRLYEKITTDYPETIYAEAARCYRITLLTLLADEENAEKAKGSTLPTGLKALQMAETEAEKFISADEFGLYRGEVMLTIGLCWLDVFTEPEKAEKWLQRSADWFEKVSKQAPPVNPPVPEKSQQVSHASDNPRYRDEWTNEHDTQIQPGQLFNRRDCPWYLTKYWAQSVTKLGLIAFARQDFDKAKKIWESLYKIDPYFQEEDEHGLAMSYVKRLLWNIEHNKGALYATPEEMAAFKDTKSRWLLLNADIEMELENYPEAEKKFRKLLKNKKIMSNKNQAAYCTFALARSLMRQLKMEEGLPIMESFFVNQKYNGTPSTRRAIEAYGRFLSQFDKIPERYKKGMAALQYLHTKYPNTEEGEYALFLLAERTIDKNEERKYIQMYLEKYPDGEYREWILELNEDDSDE